MPRRIALAITAAVLATAPAAAADVNAHGSVNQVYATGLAPGARASLVSSSGRTVARRKVDDLGALLFRHVKAGNGYRVRLADGSTSGALTVMRNASAPPSTDVYNQSIASDGYQYLTTRDGTKLAINVHPPQDISNTGGIDLPSLPVPQTYPTLIEYSGYGYADPAGPQSGIAAVANLMGFAVVDVNMRGTGCSGGAFDFFEPLQGLDGYDVIETIARQPWVKNHKVGMLGISYGGISQLFTAERQPPSLAAITPLSVIDSTQTTLYPGGILNTGFALNWAKERVHDAMPSGPDAGQPWAAKRIAGGDQTCKANQAMHREAASLLKKVRANNHYVPKVADPLAPITFVHKINVPVFMACQFTDEQTGGHCPTLARRMTGTQKKWFTYSNGTHVDSLDPTTFNRLYDFLSLYVARQAPAVNSATIQLAAPVVYQAAMGISGLTLPPDPIQQEPSYDAALKAFEALPPVRILFDNGAGRKPGEPYPGFEQSFSSFPVPGTRAQSWWLGPKGSLAGTRPAKTGANAFTWNPRARPLTDFTGDTAGGTNGLWTALPPYKWKPDPKGTALSYVTPPLAQNTVVIGAGAVQAWVRSPKKIIDVQATISEVRPDGKETFVQGGWLRSSFRKLDPKKSTLLEPWPSGRTRDLRNMPRGRFVKLTIPLYYEAHAFRAGSRIRVRLTAPNGDQPIWAFAETKPKKGTTRLSVGFGTKRPSRLLLPVVSGVNVPTGLPPCPGLRGEPCRDYQP
jgi:predicted acyl esterase